MSKRYKCPCCVENTLSDEGGFELCDVCDWQDDPLQRDDPTDNMGANSLSLNEAKAAWEQKEIAKTG